MTATRSVGRPRDPDLDRAILEATRELLRRHNYSGLRISEVASIAGVTPPTVRLRWRTKAELVHDALFREIDDRPLADTGTLVGDLRAVVQRAIALYTTPEVQAAILGFNDDLRGQPELRQQLGARVYAPAVAEFRRLLARAIARGEIAPDDAPHATTLLHTIAGTVVASLLMFGGDADTLERDLVALLSHGLDGRGSR
jgi:AcrR family transcriptional regulator